MNKPMILVVGALLFALAAVGILYSGEARKNQLLRSTSLTTSQEAQAEIKKNNEAIKKEREKDLEDRQKLLDQMTQFSKERDAAVQEKDELKKRFSSEKELSVSVNKELNTLHAEVDKLTKENKEIAAGLEGGFKKKQQVYDTRILSLEAQLAKAKSRLTKEAERYHYNLGVVYTQNKDYDSAVSEFKTALGYNPKSAQAYYNLGIIFDDYFKDKENARYYYRGFLELQPASDDADSVREWLANLDKSSSSKQAP